MGIAREFKEFAVKGNVIDMAVGVVIGAAFGKIVSSLVSDIVMPPLGLLTGRVSFADKFFALDGKGYASLEEAKQATAVITFGSFLDTVLQFLIVAFMIFLLVRQINRLKTATPPPAAPASRDCPHCLSSIPKKATRCAHCTSQVQPAA